MVEEDPQFSSLQPCPVPTTDKKTTPFEWPQSGLSPFLNMITTDISLEASHCCSCCQIFTNRICIHDSSLSPSYL